MPTRWRVLVAVAIVSLTTACGTAMSIDEAKRVTTDFSGRAFIAPPRTAHDLLTILNDPQWARSDAVAKARQLADKLPPDTTDGDRLADFYHERGRAAREIGRFRQELEDFTRAASYARRLDILDDLSYSHLGGGNVARAREIRREMLDTPGATPGWLIHSHAFLGRLQASAGDLEAAEASAREAQRLTFDVWRRPGWPVESLASADASVATALASVLEARGRYDEAARLYRESIAVLEAQPRWFKDRWPDWQRLRLAMALLRHGRHVEAEIEARGALRNLLRKRARESQDTAGALRILSWVFAEQGRYADAEAVARTSLDIYAQIGAASDAATVVLTRSKLADALVGQRRWHAAVAEYEAISHGDPAASAAVTAEGARTNHAIALLKTGDVDRAMDVLTAELARHNATLGSGHVKTAETRGLLAAAQSARGEVGSALKAFAQATSVLLDRRRELDDDTMTRPAGEQRLRVILSAYVGLLAKIRGTPAEQQAGVDATSEAFRIADVARGTFVQRGLDAAAARAAAKTPQLADLVRREQDAAKQISALYGLVTSALTTVDDDVPRRVDALRAQIDTLRRAREAVVQQIQREFVAYSQLVNPASVTLDQARSRLRPGEALITTYVDEDQTFLWAVPATGPVAFAAAPIGRAALEEIVSQLRAALEPGARTLGDIPQFDLTAAHRVYSTVLEPVAQGWRDAKSLLVIADEPLSRLPFGLLPTRPTPIGVEPRTLFATYQEVPWLIRSHAIAVLPSVTALVTLRSSSPRERGSRPFIGFGDPFFNRQHAIETPFGERDAEVVMPSAPNRQVALRSSPRIRHLNSSRLAMLPRLPDTADELRSIARTLDADLERDVFLGARANETTVKKLDLASYRIVAFATHGLLPGDLDGLTQPALALSAPEVADVDGDGLLTMDEILGLRLNAHWIVLSACNTASGHGAGGEALSGLGRAFFYAGARALLVSNWPVETTSARALTTDLFRRQKDNPGLTRSGALQETIKAMIDGPGFVDGRTNTAVFSYAHPIFWAAFTLVGDGGDSR